VTVRSLTAKLSLGIALIVLLSVGLMAGLAVWHSAKALRERALATNHTVALGVSHAGEQYVADAVAIMREAAERPKLRQEITSGNWHEARTVLENITRHFRQFDYVFTQDSQGTIRARVPHAETVGEDFSSRDFFREAMQTGQPYLSGVHVPKAAQRPVIAIAVPVLHADGRVAGVLVGALSLQTMSRLVAIAAHDDGRAIYLVDGHGHLVADSRAPVESLRNMQAEPVVQAVLGGRAGTMIYRRPGGSEQLLAAHVPIKPFGWGVVVTRSTAAAEAPAARLGVVLIWMAVGCTAGAIAVGVGFARRLTRPLLRLAEASERIAAGELSTRVVVSGPADVATLARAFNQMGDAVAQSHQTLAQRAAEVETMNRQLIEEAAGRQQAEAAIRYQAERLAVLHEIDRGLLAAETPAAIAEATLGRVRELLGVPRAIVNLFNLAAGEAEWLAAAGRRRIHVTPGVRFPLALMGNVDALRRGEPQMIDVDALPHGPEVEALLASGVRVYMVVPMIARGELIGGLSFGGARGQFPFPAEQLSIAHEVADQMALAIADARLVDALRQNEERIRLIIEASLEAVITMDASGAITGWNPQAERVFGWGQSEALGRSLAETIVPERDREAHRRGIQHFLATGVGPILNKRIEVTALHRSGREFPVELTISAAHVGSTVLFSGFVRDLTEVKRAERRQAVQFAVARVLAETTTLSEKVPLLLEAISTSIGWELAELWNVDPEGPVLRWAGAWHIPGLEAGEFEAISREMTLAPGADVPGRVWATDEPIWMTDALAGMHPARASAAGPLGLRAALGCPVRGTTGVIGLLTFFSRSPRPRDDDLDAVMDDVSGRIGQLIERQRAQEALGQAEEQVRQLQRLEAVGRLAGGVAHDFNNLLTVIMGRGAILLGRLPADDPHRRDIALIKKTAERAAALTKQLLAFSRKQILAPKVLDLNTVVSGMVTMLQRLIGEDIELVFLPGSELGRVKADPGQLEQVIANLVVNARDAMPNGGRLTLETTAVDLSEHYARQHVGVQAGSYVMLGVSDTGIGMDRETQARIFDPFFTTKEPGKGTGLGLATVYGIVKQSGGNIWVYSEPGKGTTFKVYLPQVHDAEDAAEPEQVRPGRGTETLLIVEDEDEVRALACEVLATYGYEVLQARTPADALLIAERHTGPVHLLLTDVIMPGMSGRILAERLAPLRPEMTVLYMSGYTDEAIVHHGTLDAGTPFIQKPFTPDALAAGVRRLLDTVG
jgi:two-component system cell cycle sensor histidine kinase/response regulator CckA